MSWLAAGVLSALSVFGSTPRAARLPHVAIAHRTVAGRVDINDNRRPGGTLKDGVLTISLEVRDGEWHPDRDSDPGLVLHAFAEAGKPASIPGPLIRVPEGTEIHVSLHNVLDSAIVVHGLSTRGGSSSTADTVQVAPGVTRQWQFRAGAAGTYYYWGATRPVAGRGPIARWGIDEELSGALIIDPRGATGPARDRVFVINLWTKSVAPGALVGRPDLLRFTINGKSWPNTERLTYTVGDTVRFRIVNTSTAPHPMHLHGFYFTVNSRGDGTSDTTYDRNRTPQMAVTERVAPGRTISMTWIPDRAGYWMFHCHDNFHVLRNAPLDGTPLPLEQDMHPQNHAVEMMGGLVMGIEVRPSGTAAVVDNHDVRRKLRLVARVDTGGTVGEPAYGYVLQDGTTTTTPPHGPLLPGPTIVLKRGEPVSITVVNELTEATAVHWHGIELDSYFDGVAGFAGHPGQIAPAIAPRDSFEARFTPPRSGTFIYHPHADELRQQQAGLAGALVVMDDPTAFDPRHDIVLLITVPRREADRDMVLLNGSLTPPLRELRVGERYRLRIVDIHPYRPSMIARLVSDSTPVTWRAVAKDGRDLPPDQATPRASVQQLGNGETYDFEFIPSQLGDFRFTVSSGVGALLVSMPMRVTK
jgi:FtsP/CotA-like multicopper oxidase with cupredoxin domain